MNHGRSSIAHSPFEIMWTGSWAKTLLTSKPSTPKESNRRPTWSVVLRYELEIRKEETRRMNLAGSTIADALHLARLSDDIRTRYLITPLSLGGQRTQQEEVPRPLAVKGPVGPKMAAQTKKRTGPPNTQGQQQQSKRRKHQGKEHRYGRVRREDREALHNTHSGKSICYAFQRPKGCSRGAESASTNTFAHIASGRMPSIGATGTRRCDAK